MWTDIVKRIDEASGPDASIDLDIARKLGVTIMRHNRETHGNDEASYWQYTSKVDDALSLVPVAAEWEITTLYGVAMVKMPLNASSVLGPIVVTRKDGNVAMALCSCALQTRDAFAEGYRRG